MTRCLTSVITLFSPMAKGVKLMRQERINDAISFFNGLVARKKSLPDAYYNLGKCYFKTGMLRKAKEAFLALLSYPVTDETVRGILEITNWRMLASNRYCNNWPSFSCDGSKVAFVSARRDTNGNGKLDPDDCCGIYIYDLESDTEIAIVDDDFHNMMPVFSPDGGRLAYLSARKERVSDPMPGQGSAHGLYIMNLDAGTEEKLLDSSFKVKHVTFSSNGENLIFSCWRPGHDTSAIYSMNLANRTMEILVPGVHESTFPSVAASGNKLVYSSWRRDTNDDGVINIRDNSGIYLRDMRLSTEQNIAPDIYNNTFPVFSPNGYDVLFLSARRDTDGDGRITSQDNSGIYLWDSVLKQERCIVSDRFYNKFAGFTPDGKEIVFLSHWCTRKCKAEAVDYFQNKGIYLCNLYGKGVRQIVSDKFYGCRCPAISPKGDFVVYVSWRNDTNRGLYCACLKRLPSKKELREWIDSLQ